MRVAAPRSLWVAARSRALSSLKASPTVQKLLRKHGLQSATIKPTGPKGTVTPADVQAAAAAAAEADAAASVPVTVEIPQAKTYLLPADAVPTTAVTNKKELLHYYKTMCE